VTTVNASTTVYGAPYVNLLGTLAESITETLATVFDIEEHSHNYERWLGKLAVPAGGKVADEATLTPFQAASGSNTWGTPIQLLDVNDTPLVAGKPRFDPHRIAVVDTSQTTTYRIRIVVGDTYAAGIAANTYTEVMLRVAAATRMVPIDIRIPNQLSGTKLWASVWNATNLATVDFFIGVHDYNE